MRRVRLSATDALLAGLALTAALAFGLGLASQGHVHRLADGELFHSHVHVGEHGHAGKGREASGSAPASGRHVDPGEPGDGRSDREPDPATGFVSLAVAGLAAGVIAPQLSPLLAVGEPPALVAGPAPQTAPPLLSARGPPSKALGSRDI